MTDKMRSEFEKEYPIPYGADFNGSAYVGPINVALGMSDYNARWESWQAAWQAARTVPEGFVVVPDEPTKGMVMAGYHPDFKYAQRVEMYKAMLSAAPEGMK